MVACAEKYSTNAYSKESIEVSENPGAPNPYHRRTSGDPRLAKRVDPTQPIQSRANATTKPPTTDGPGFFASGPCILGRADMEREP